MLDAIPPEQASERISPAPFSTNLEQVTTPDGASWHEDVGDATSSDQGTLASGQNAREPGEELARHPTVMVTLDGDEHPWQWSKAKRVWVTGWSSYLLFIATIASSAPTGASAQIRAKFGLSNEANVLIVSAYLWGLMAGPLFCAPLSEAYGRRKPFYLGAAFYALFHGLCAVVDNFGGLLVLRFLAGVSSSPPNTNSGAIIGDVWPPESRGIPMSLFSLAPFCGPSLGPMIGGFIGPSSLGYKWVFIILCILGGVSSIATFFFLPETYAPVLRYEKARRLQKAGQPYMRSDLDNQRQNWHKNLLVWIRRPLEMLVKEPILAVMCLYMALAFAIIYMLFGAYPIIFEEIHGLSPGLAGCAFFGVLIGSVCAVPVSLYFNKVYLRRVEENGGVALPEFRLPMGTWGVLAFGTSIIWLGWGGYKKSTSIWVPISSGIFTGLGATLIFRAFQAYLIDLYKRYAASALACQVIARSTLGGILPLFIANMMHTMGVNWAATFLGLLMLAMLPAPLLFMRYGAALRARSKFAVAIDEAPTKAPRPGAEKG